MPPADSRRAGRWRAAAAAVAVSAAAACGGGAQAPGASTDSGDLVREPERAIRLALPPTAVWSWLADSGELEAWEQRHGLRVEVSHPFSTMAAFVSGHADVVMASALDLPSFGNGDGRRPVIIGKHSADRSMVLARRTTQAADLADVVEERVAVASQLGSTLLWALIADQQHSLHLADGGDDFEFVVSSVGVADVVERGEAAACICLPDRSVENLSSGMLHPLYGGQSAAEVYEQMPGAVPSAPLDEVLVANADWLAANPDLADAFLDLWQRGLDRWNSSFGDIIERYPHLFSLETDAQVAWLRDYVADHNWVAESVRLTATDREHYLRALDQLREMGLVEAGLTSPDVAVDGTAVHRGSDAS